MGQGRWMYYTGENKDMSRSSVPPSAFMKQLIARVDPHRPPQNVALQSAQALCGRWVWLRRVQIDLTSTVLAGMATITADDLLLIEAGLALPQQITEDACQRLGQRLTPNHADRTLGVTVVRIALGQAEALSEATLERVLDDIEDAGMSAEERKRHLAVDLVEQPAPALAEGAAPFDRRVFERELGMFEVLAAMARGARDVHAIWYQQREDSRPIEMVQVGTLLSRLRQSQLVSVTGRQADPDLPGESVTVYQLTSEGWRAFNAENLHRQVQQAKAPASESVPGWGGATGSPLPNASG